jgi:hypothetical protein
MPKKAEPDAPQRRNRTFTLPRWVTEDPRFDGKLGEIAEGTWLYSVIEGQIAALEKGNVTLYGNPLYRLFKRLLNACKALINKARRRR